jgi:two-component system, OmpR family, KDP operon response regulator KdpE
VTDPAAPRYVPPMTAHSIVVIDDEPQIRRVIRNAFGDGTGRVLEAGSGTEGIDLVAAEQPDLVILDLGLPDRDGEEVCRAIRQWSPVPILVLSARHSDDEKVRLLDAGADDYVTKPFSTAELQARARALLRRVQGPRSDAESRIAIGELELDFGSRTFRRAEEAVHLTPVEWDLLATLMKNAGRTLTHRYLFNQVWRGRQFGDAQQYLRVYVAHLRRKIEPDPLRPRYILTEPGVGYRFAAAVESKS